MCRSNRPRYINTTAESNITLHAIASPPRTRPRQLIVTVCACVHSATSSCVEGWTEGMGEGKELRRAVYARSQTAN